MSQAMRGGGVLAWPGTICACNLDPFAFSRSLSVFLCDMGIHTNHLP